MGFCFYDRFSFFSIPQQNSLHGYDIHFVVFKVNDTRIAYTKTNNLIIIIPKKLSS